MRALAIFLRVIAPVFVLVGVLHVLLGLGADAALGAKVPPEALTDPGLDSQNRFYGAAFTLYGILLWLCSSDLAKHATVLRCVLWVFFASGLARLVSILVYGVPPSLIVGLLLSELIGPPLIIWWFARVQPAS
jgi:hypothetical protein